MQASGAAASSQFGKLQVQNVVGTYWTGLNGDNIGVKESSDIDLPSIAIASGGKYGPSVFPAVVCKMRCQIRGVPDPPLDPVATYPLQRRQKEKEQPRGKKAKNNKFETPTGQMLLQYCCATDSQFKSGQNVVAGGTSELTNLLIAYKYTQRVSRYLHLDLRVYNYTTQNIVCSTFLGYTLNIEWLARDGESKGWSVFYIPEEFIGLTLITEDNGKKVVYVVFDTGKIVATGMKAMDVIPIAEARLQAIFPAYQKGREPKDFDASRSRLRDADILSGIKADITSSAAAAAGGGGAGSHAKDNASMRLSKKVLNQVKAMMKNLEIVEAGPRDDSEEAQEELMNAIHGLGNLNFG